MRARIFSNFMIVAAVIGSGLWFSSRAAAEVVAETQIAFGKSGSNTIPYGAGIAQGPNSSTKDTGVGFTYTGTTLGFGDIALDEGSDWYLVDAGDVLSGSTIDANQFPVIVKSIKDPPFFQTNGVPIPLGDFYLGMTTGLGFTNGLPNRTIYGWLELNNTGTELIPVANAVDYGDGGIIVGTTAVPEPASAFLLATPSVFLFGRQRRGRYSHH